MTPAPDLSTLSLPQLVALDTALRAAIRAAQVAGGGAFEAALLVDAEGASVTFTVFCNPNEETTT